MLYEPKFSQSILITALLLALLVAPPPWAFLLRPGAASASSLSTPQESNEPQAASLKAATVSAVEILINEVMFQPDFGGSEWIELKTVAQLPSIWMGMGSPMKMVIDNDCDSGKPCHGPIIGRAALQARKIKRER